MRSSLKKASPSPSKRKREMRQRREIAARPDRALLRNDRADAAIQHFHEQLDDFEPNPAKAEREHVRPQQHHRAHLWLGERTADAAGMAADEIDLQLLQLVGRNVTSESFPKPVLTP